MTRDVIIKIRGIQTGEDMEDETEIICAGVFFEKDGRCYVRYEESVEGMEGTIQSLIKFDKERLEVTKRGLTRMNMVLEKGKRNHTFYNTPFGDLTVGTMAERIDVRRDGEEIVVEADYDLEVNYEHLAASRIVIRIQEKDEKETHLLS